MTAERRLNILGDDLCAIKAEFRKRITDLEILTGIMRENFVKRIALAVLSSIC